MEREIKKITQEEFERILLGYSEEGLPSLPRRGVLVASDGDNDIELFSPIGFEADSWGEVVKAVRNIPLEQENIYYCNNSSNMNYCNRWYTLFSETETSFFHFKEVEKRGCDSKYRGWDILKPFWELSESFSKIVIPIRCDFMRTVPGRHSPLYSKYRATILAHIEERSEDIIHSASYGMYYIRSDKAKIVANDGKIILSKETGRETLDEIENPFHSYNKKWEWEKSDQFKEVVSLSEKRNDLEKSLKKLLFFKEVVEKAGRVPNFLISWKPGRPKYGVLFRELRKNHPKGQAKRIALEEIEKYREETEPDFVSLYNRRRAELAEVSAEIKKINLVVEAMREEEEEEEKKKWKQEVAAFLKKYSGVPIKN